MAESKTGISWWGNLSDNQGAIQFAVHTRATDIALRLPKPTTTSAKHNN